MYSPQFGKTGHDNGDQEENKDRRYTFGENESQINNHTIQKLRLQDMYKPVSIVSNETMSQLDLLNKNGDLTADLESSQML